MRKRIKKNFEKRFRKHPLIGNVVYGVLIGVMGILPLFSLIFALLFVTGIYSRMNIDYKSWWLFITVAACLALLVFMYGAMAYFPYRRKGNGSFGREYLNGTTYKALSSVLNEKKNNKGGI